MKDFGNLALRDIENLLYSADTVRRISQFEESEVMILFSNKKGIKGFCQIKHPKGGANNFAVSTIQVKNPKKKKVILEIFDVIRKAIKKNG